MPAAAPEPLRLFVKDLSCERWLMRPVGDLSGVPSAVRSASTSARVPGCVHTDLIRASLIPDPRIGLAEREIQWIGLTDWEYRVQFDLDAHARNHERLDLVCESLDTIAEIAVNGREIGRAANMFHPHRLDLRGAARPGPNELIITFRSPLKHIRADEVRLGRRPVNGDWDPYIFIRKPACNFGWDWAPKVATCGICGPVRVEAWNHARIAAVRPLIARERGTDWRIDVHVSLDWASRDAARSTEVRVTLEHSSGQSVEATAAAPAGQPSIVASLRAHDPSLWWPRGYGDSPTCALSVRLDDQPQDAWTKQIAFREVRLNTDPDSHGHKFQLEINSRPIFCKGANWIPEGLFPDDRSDDTIRARVRQAAAANMNMLRVWGGGQYESDAFYEECDKQGIMVWQDFMFACACYPEEAPYPQLIEAEARHQIARLASHPSVVLYCGGNECIWGYESWGHAATDVEGPWKKRVGDKTWGAAYYYDLMPRLLRELDPTRPYWPNSPFAGKPNENPNQTDRGDRHTWDVKVEGYKTIVPRFCSEFGHQSPPSLELLEKAVGAEHLSIGSAALEHFQRATGGTAKHIDESLRERYSPAKTFEEWHAQAQEMQARALTIGIGWLAANRPRCMGALIWQFNDAWPAPSWSLIDSAGTPKPAYYAVKKAFGRIAP